MRLTDKGLANIEAVADARHNADMMMLCQILRELRELKGLIKQTDDPDDSADGGQD